MEDQPIETSEALNDPTQQAVPVEVAAQTNNVDGQNVTQTPEQIEEPGILDRSRAFISDVMQTASEELVSFVSLPENSVYNPNSKIINVGLKIAGGLFAAFTGYALSKGGMSGDTEEVLATVLPGLSSMAMFAGARWQSKVANEEARTLRQPYEESI